MAEIAVAPFMFTGEVTLGANGYTHHITECTLQPTAKSTIVKDIAGVAHPLGGNSDWALSGTAFQDVVTANSFTAFTLANDGATVAATMTVNGVEYEFSVTVSATALGGTPDSPATAQFSWPATKPVLAD